MASTRILISIIVIVLIILIGATVAAYYALPKTGNTEVTRTTTTGSGTSATATSSSNPISSTTTSSSLASTTPLSTVTSSSVLTSTYTGSSAYITVVRNSTVSSSTSYGLQLAKAGSGPVVSSPMSTPMGRSYFPSDGPCCGGGSGAVVNYNDGGNRWVWQGDIEPGSAWASANSTGLTVNLQTCFRPSACGPNHEFWGDKEAFDDISIYGDLGGIPGNATLFSVDAYLPYHSYYSTCQQDLGSGGSGCTYEIAPYDGAALAYVANGNYMVVSFAEICNSPCTSNALQMSAFVSAGGSSIVKTLALINEPTYTPFHRLTIATDRKSYIDFYVDNTLIYSNSTLPANLGSGGLAQIELSQRTSINGEISQVTWSNLQVYSSSMITVGGLSSGMTAVATGPGGFNQTSTANSSSGVAMLNVALQPSNITVSVEQNGKVVDTYAAKVGAGAQLNFAANVSTTTIVSSYTTTRVTTYTSTNSTTVVTTYTTSAT